MDHNRITVETAIEGDLNKCWDYWTLPDHITKWCAASDDWHCPKAVNDLKAGGKFVTTMAAKDGSIAFDFEGIYDRVEPQNYIAYTMSDGRKAEITFTSSGSKTHVSETFDPESQHPTEMQQAGWQAILDNFKKYVQNN